MSRLLDALIQERKAGAIAYKKYLDRVAALTRRVKNPAESATYPPTLNSPAKRALYDNFGEDEELALELDYVIRSTKKDGWRGDDVKEREIKYAIHQVVGDEGRGRAHLHACRRPV